MLRRRPAPPPGAPSAVLLGTGVFLLVVAVAGFGVLADPNTNGEGGASDADPLVHVRLLGVNDFHGHLQSTERLEKRGSGREVALGGAANLASHLDRAAAARPQATIRVHAGDMVGASPLVSSHFHDEPTVKAMNLMRFDVGTLGNHEFDEGGQEMLRLIRGGHREDGLQFKRDAEGDAVDTSDPSFGGADFPYVAANAVDARSGELVLPPYRVVERDGVRIGFIGVTTTATPIFLLRRFARDFRYLDISDAVNRYVPELERQGVHAIVVLAHSGAFEAGATAAHARGEIIGEAREMDSAVDVVVAGHTHSHLNQRLPNADGRGEKLVVEAWSYGTAYDKVDMTVDRGTGEVVAKSAETPRTWSDSVAPEPRLQALVTEHARAVAPLAGRVVGRARTELRNAPGELGRIVAEGQRRYANADLAVVNRGSLRDGLAAGEITYSDLFTVHAYEHRLVRMELRGDAVAELLDRVGGDGRSAEVYTAGVRCGCDPQRTYTVVANELIADSDAFDVLRRGRSRRTLGTDLEALVAEVERRRVIG